MINLDKIAYIVQVYIKYKETVVLKTLYICIC